MPVELNPAANTKEPTRDTLKLLLFSSVADKDGNTYYWYYQNHVAILGPIYHSQIDKTDENGFPANAVIDLDFVTRNVNPETLEVSYPEEIDYIWNPDTNEVSVRGTGLGDSSMQRFDEPVVFH